MFRSRYTKVEKSSIISIYDVNSCIVWRKFVKHYSQMPGEECLYISIKIVDLVNIISLYLSELLILYVSSFGVATFDYIFDEVKSLVTVITAI